MSALLTGALISGGIGIVKAIIGGVQAASGTRQLNRLLKNRPTYTIPEAYQKALGIYGNLAASEMPGQQYYENRIGESTARTVSNAERGAISSNVFQGAVSNAQDKELQAIQGLAKMGAEYRTTQMQNYGQALNQYGQLQDKQWEVNQFQPWEIKTNMANEKKMAGVQNLWGGLNEIGSTAMNFAGTSYYIDAMKEMARTQNYGTSPVFGAPPPLATPNIANTAPSMGIPISWSPTYKKGEQPTEEDYRHYYR